jgi:hypothetical protein
MNIYTRHYCTTLLLIAFITTPLSCNKSDIEGIHQPELSFVKGVYGNPGTLLEAGYRFDDLGLNAIFVRSISLNQTLFETARLQNVKVFVEFPTLLGRNYVEQHPEAWPIDKHGEKSPPADWFMGVCPTDPGFWEYRKTQLSEILELYDVDGIFLDYVHWHAQFETPEPILPETCFCDRCTALFAEDTGISVQGSDISGKAAWILENADTEWRDWRSRVLNGWVTGMKEIVKEMRPEALLGIFYCSWYPDDYDGALYRTLGIDIETFIEMADVLSPMLFHKMKDRPVSWVGEYTNWLGNLVDKSAENRPLIWPIVQAHDNPGEVTPDEFREVMMAGSGKPSSGIMMFSDRALLDNPDKIDVMLEHFNDIIYD